MVLAAAAAAGGLLCAASASAAIASVYATKGSTSCTLRNHSPSGGHTAAALSQPAVHAAAQRGQHGRGLQARFVATHPPTHPPGQQQGEQGSSHQNQHGQLDQLLEEPAAEEMMGWDGMGWAAGGEIYAIGHKGYMEQGWGSLWRGSAVAQYQWLVWFTSWRAADSPGGHDVEQGALGSLQQPPRHHQSHKGHRQLPAQPAQQGAAALHRPQPAHACREVGGGAAEACCKPHVCGSR